MNVIFDYISNNTVTVLLCVIVIMVLIGLIATLRKSYYVRMIHISTRNNEVQLNKVIDEIGKLNGQMNEFIVRTNAKNNDSWGNPV